MFTITGNKSYELESKDDFWFINGSPVEFEIVSKGGGKYVVFHDNKAHEAILVSSSDDKKELVITIEGVNYPLQVKDNLDILIEKMGMSSSKKKSNDLLKAPMPGLILSLEVTVGQTVQTGEKLCVLEAMKMENNLKAEHPVEVAEILVKTGESVEKNQVIMKFKESE